MTRARTSSQDRRWLAPSLLLASRLGGAVTLVGGAVTLVGGAATLVGCASTPDTMVLGLRYQPTSTPDVNKLQGAQPILAAMRVWINPVIDRHPEGTQIGVSQEEDNAPVYFGANGLPPADFVRAAMAQVLAAYAVPVAADSNTHTHVLQLEMTQFWTVEDNTYLATIGGSLVLADRAGQVLWKGNVVGSSKRWGRTFTAETYLQAFSDAALDLSTKLALDPGFRAAMNTGG